MAKQLEWKVGAGSYAKLLDIIDYGSIGFEQVKIDTTNQDSKHTTSRAGIPSVPDTTFKIPFCAETGSTWALMKGYMATLTEIDFKYTCGTHFYTFKGYASVSDPAIGIDGRLKCDFKILVSSSIVVG